MDSGDFAHIINQHTGTVMHIRKDAIIAFSASEAHPDIAGVADYNTTIWLTTGETINVVAHVRDVAKAIYDDVMQTG